MFHRPCAFLSRNITTTNLCSTVHVHFCPEILLRRTYVPPSMCIFVQKYYYDEPMFHRPCAFLSRNITTTILCSTVHVHFCPEILLRLSYVPPSMCIFVQKYYYDYPMFHRPCAFLSRN